MKVILDRSKMQQGLVARGLSIRELAVKARIGCSTAARAVAGRSVSAWTAYSIAIVLEEQPVAPSMDGWLAQSERAFHAFTRSED